MKINFKKEYERYKKKFEVLFERLEAEKVFAEENMNDDYDLGYVSGINTCICLLKELEDEKYNK